MELDRLKLYDKIDMRVAPSATSTTNNAPIIFAITRLEQSHQQPAPDFDHDTIVDVGLRAAEGLLASPCRAARGLQAPTGGVHHNIDLEGPPVHRPMGEGCAAGRGGLSLPQAELSDVQWS